MGSAGTISDADSCRFRRIRPGMVSACACDDRANSKRVDICSSAVDTATNTRVAIKKLARPFQSAVHAKRTYRELKLLKHMRHENVIGLLNVFYPEKDSTQVRSYIINPSHFNAKFTYNLTGFTEATRKPQKLCKYSGLSFTINYKPELYAKLNEVHNFISVWHIDLSHFYSPLSLSNFSQNTKYYHRYIVKFACTQMICFDSLD